MGSASSKDGKEIRNCWDGKIYFDPGPHLSNWNRYFITEEELKTVSRKYVKDDDVIETIWHFKCDLLEWQITHVLTYHAYIILQTGNYYWSIERNKQGVTIQRSTKMSFIKDKYRRLDRRGVGLICKTPGKGSMKELIKWLYYSDELVKEYHFVYANCHVFAEKLFERFSI